MAPPRILSVVDGGPRARLIEAALRRALGEVLVEEIVDPALLESAVGRADAIVIDARREDAQQVAGQALAGRETREGSEGGGGTLIVIGDDPLGRALIAEGRESATWSRRAVGHAVANALAIVMANVSFALDVLDPSDPGHGDGRDRSELRDALADALAGCASIEAVVRGLRGPTPNPRPGRRARVLVVDAEPRIGEVVRRILAREHEVVCVESGAAALSLVDAGSRFDLILCDAMLRGVDLHAELLGRSEQQASRVVLMAAASARAAIAPRPGVTSIDKPFTADLLRGLVAASVTTPEGD
jgi:CheY-like chemotaxis protein